MLPTPDTSHVPYQRVYEPAEDSFLLLDTLSSPSETAFLTSRFGNNINTTISTSSQPPPPPPPLILEVGPGSGVVIAFLTAHAQTILGTPHVLACGVDVNRFACAATAKTAARAIAEAKDDASSSSSSSSPGAGFFLDAVQGDLVAPVRAGMIDVLVFNPPYVPTAELPAQPQPESEAEQQQQQQRGTVVRGGRDGMETTDRLIAALPTALSERGCAYVLLCAQNKPEEVKEQIRAMGGGGGGGGGRWKAETVGTSGKQAGWEKLQIVRIWRDYDGVAADTTGS
ncbi:methyltransferase domain-containing protein [Bombardia bombarda]|uniref:Methyltransferase domain-containing protein n=1 Tax=Bombardia bombarda TaxID=252184 RepID=A0AA39WD38_9PEZI|nr:methyltransferase domain-containing protein [Bombardia bombarda]